MEGRHLDLDAEVRAQGMEGGFLAVDADRQAG